MTIFVVLITIVISNIYFRMQRIGIHTNCFKRQFEHHRAHLTTRKIHDMKFVAVLNPNDESECHFLIHGLRDTPFEGGFYHGKIRITEYYPFRQPSITIITPNGRFLQEEDLQYIMFGEPNDDGSFWSAAYDIEKIIISLIAMMTSESQE